jgi:hypothetical protein
MAFNAAKLREAGDKPDWGEPPLGSHIAALSDTRAFTSSKGQDWCTLTFQIQGGAHNGHEWDLLLALEESNRSLWKTYRQLKAIGIDLSKIESLFELDEELQQHRGRVFALDVEQDGQWRNTWIKGEQTQMSLNGAGETSDVPIDTAGLPTAAVADDFGDVPF